MLNYREAKRILNGFSSPLKPRKNVTRPMDRVKLANNTYLERVRYPQYRTQLWNEIVMTLHDHIIVRFTPHWIELDSCGWPTMTTRDRLTWTPIDIRAERGGWTLYLWTMIPCHSCKGTKTDPYGGGFTYADELVTPDDGRRPYHPAIWHPAPCDKCDANGLVEGHDWASGGHPFFDGIRVSNDGRRLLQSQPNRPENFESVKTISGFTRTALNRYGYDSGQRYYGVAV